jgi:glycosyltransferase involved in cell wall biosynthesis
MRFLINAVTVSPRSPGNWAHLYNLLQGWSAAQTSDRILLASNASFPEDVEDSLADLIDVHRAGSRRLGMLVTQHVRLDRLARRFRADAVLNATPVAAALVPVRAPQATIVHDIRHTVRPEEFRRRQIVYRDLVYGRSIRGSDAVIAVSESTRDHLVRELGIPHERIHVVRHGADHVDRWVRGEPGTHGIAFAHWSNKRPDVAVHAWAILRDSVPGFDRPLEIVGVGPDVRQVLASSIADRGLEGLVRMHGYLPDPNYQRLFSSAAVVLLPSTLEGFGLPVIEGLRLGIPVVVSVEAGAEEAGGDAAIYASGDAQSFAAECARLFADDAWRDQVVARGRGHAASFTWTGTALATRAVLEEVVPTGG